VRLSALSRTRQALVVAHDVPCDLGLGRQLNPARDLERHLDLARDGIEPQAGDIPREASRG